MYNHLVENGAATTQTLVEMCETAVVWDKPEQGYYQSEYEWFRDVGRRGLASLPGIEPPESPYKPAYWRFVGVSEGEHLARDLDRERAEEVVESADIPGRGEWIDRRQETILQLFVYIREEEPVSTDELREQIDPSDIGYSGSGAFWVDVAVDVLTEIPGIEESGGTWKTGNRE